ncbi:MAG: relaxase/mobilization nuclease domain-containing protein [Crenarchaeota archaeon]|nr:relaxase/mobilization nuclease domain-containing protein [Thermoproteota archaeon]
MAITKIHPIKSSLKKAIAYVVAAGKTEEGFLVTSFACAPETADLEFSFTLSHCMQKGNNLAFHLIQSFKPDETDPETAHKIGVELSNGFLKDQYEYVLSTHVDKDHIHNHLIFCAANFLDHRKFVSNRRSYYQIRKLSDRLCQDFGLSVVVTSEEKGKAYKEYLAHQTGTSWKTDLRRAISQTIKHSQSYEEFLLRLNVSGYETKQNQGILFRKIGQQRYVKGRTLGLPYTLEQIKKNFLQKQTHANQSQTSDRLPSLIDIDAYLKAIKNKGYARSLEIKNLKAISKSLLFLEEQGIYTVGSLDNKLREVKEEFEATRVEIKKLEDKISELSEIAKHIRTIKEITKNSEAYMVNLTQSKHIILQSSIKVLKEKGIEPFSLDVHALQKDLQDLIDKKRQLYIRYREVKVFLRQIRTARSNLNCLYSPSQNLEVDKQ